MEDINEDEEWILVHNPNTEDQDLKKDPGLPRQHPTEAVWQIPPDPLLQHYRSTEDLPAAILDVVIIGSGLSGTSVAWHLLHGEGEPQEKYLSTLMLEARDICSGATGRNGGHLSCDFYTFYSEAVMLYDETQAAKRSFFDKMNFDAITELVKREGIDCEYKDNGGGWNVYLTKDDFEMAKRDVEGMKAAGGYVSSLKIFEGQDAAEAAGVKHCAGAIYTRERASLKPYGLVTALLRTLVEEHLLQLHTRTPVTGITPPSGKRQHYTIHTTRGDIKARHVVNATNAWIGHLYPEFRGIINPTRGQVIQVEGKHLNVQPTGWNDGRDYLVQRPDGTLIFGGGRRFSLSPTHESGNTDDTTVDPCVSQFLRSFLPTQFPLVSIAGNPPPVNAIREWTGIMGYPADFHPYVGRIPSEPRKWVIGGFYGHGMVRIWLCGKALVQQLLAEESNQSLPWPDWMPYGYILRPDRLN